MSRIRGIEVKVQKEILQTHKYGLNEILKKKNDNQLASSKDDAERYQINELLHKLPRLDKIFEVHRKIGEGTFSSVYLGSLRKHAALPDSEKRWFAIKHLVPTAHPARIEHELRCLQDMGGKNHVIGVELCLRNLDTIVFVMPYIPHKKFSDYVGDMDAEELRQYMRALLTALQHVHSFGVIHRDVKPSNFLYDRDNRRYLLVDFGLAQRVCPAPDEPLPAHSGPRKRLREEAAAGACACAGAGGVCASCAARPAPRAPRAGTQGFRPPEVLLKCPRQTTAVDVWAAGVVLASALTARYPLLRAPDDLAALAELADLLGTSALQRAARAMGRRLVTSVTRRGRCLRSLAAQRSDQVRDTDQVRDILTKYATLTNGAVPRGGLRPGGAPAGARPRRPALGRRRAGRALPVCVVPVAPAPLYLYTLSTIYNTRIRNNLSVK